MSEATEAGRAMRAELEAFRAEAVARTFELQAEAVACMWEEVACNRDDALWAPYLEHNGTPALRHAVIGLTEPLLAAWDALTEDERESLIPYDWEFVPTFLRQCVEWDANGYGPTVRPDAVAILKRIAGEEEATRAEGEERERNLEA
jgi:hypothetical protein